MGLMGFDGRMRTAQSRGDEVVMSRHDISTLYCYHGVLVKNRSKKLPFRKHVECRRRKIVRVVSQPQEPEYRRGKTKSKASPFPVSMSDWQERRQTRTTASKSGNLDILGKSLWRRVHVMFKLSNFPRRLSSPEFKNSHARRV